MSHSAEVFVRRDGVVSQESQGTTVLLRLSDGAYYTVDEVGAAVWGRCDGVADVEAIVTDICANFDAGPEVVRADVEEFIAELVGEGLLEQRA